MSEICYINGRFLSQEITGVQRYADELTKTLDAMIDAGEIDSGGLKFIILTPRRIIRRLDLKHISIRRVGFFSGHLWEQIELPRYGRGGLLISLCNAGPLMKRNQIVTIHDAGVFAMPRSYSPVFRAWYRLLLIGLGKAARRVLTVSEFSRKELDRYAHISPTKIRSIYHGREHIMTAPSDDRILEKLGLSERPFLLAVSSLSPRKNFQAVIKAISILGQVDFDIVIAGGTNPKVFGNSDLAFPDHIRCPGHVTDGELKTLYRHAAAFIFPSFYEGFGLPPLEAMTCGCPVIVSDIPPHREVCRKAAVYCDPHSIEDIAEKIRRVMDDFEVRNILSESGRQRAAAFSWRKAAGEFHSVVKELVNH